MNFRQLEVFIGIVDHGNFTKAAHALYLTQPTVSSHIDSLEKELGVILFERKSRAAVLTEAGELFYPYALNLLSLKQRGIRALDKYQDRFEGSIQLAASATPGTYLLPHIIKSFTDSYPLAKFAASISKTSDVLDSVLNYHVDVGFVGSMVKNKQLHFLPVFCDEMAVIASRQHRPLPSSKQVTLGFLIEQPLVLRGEGSATREGLEQALDSVGVALKDLNIVMETDNLEALLNCVRADLGMSVVPRVCICGDAQLECYTLTDVQLQRTFYGVYHKSRIMSPTVDRFVRFLRKELRIDATSLSRQRRYHTPQAP